jgi:hypothetical protein
VPLYHRFYTIWDIIPLQKAVVLCDDISFGQELVPVACIADEGLLDSVHILADNSDGQNVMPWESFTYVVKPLLDQSVGRDTEVALSGT